MDVVHGQVDSVLIYVGLSLNLKGLLNLKPVSPLGLMKKNPKANTDHNGYIFNL